MTSKVLVALRVAVSPERAFEAFTREIAAWWSPNAMFRFTPRDPGLLSFEPGAGGRLIETLPSGKVFEIGKIFVWSPPTRLVFGWRQATFAPDQATEVEVRFDQVGGETRVTVEHRGWEAIPTAHVAKHRWPNEIFLQRHGEWWKALLEHLRSRVEAEQGGGV